MTEPGFREIQLSTKQLVFLFIATVVVAVVIFLLGVSVGRGVDANLQQAGGIDPVPGDTTVSTGPPEAVAGEVDAGAPPVSSPSADADAAAGEPPVSSDPVVTDPVVSDPPPAPPPPDPDPVVAEPPPASPLPAPGEWALQVGAFGARENADALVETLRLRGYPVYLQQTDSTTVPFSVRVGPYASRAQAEAASTRLSNEPEAYEAIIVR